MRTPLRAAAGCAAFVCVACGDAATEPEIDLRLGAAVVRGDANAPDALAELDATAELVANVDLEGVEVTSVSILRLPEGPDSSSLTFEVSVLGPRDASSLTLPADELVVARITNLQTTNAELQSFCGAAVVLHVVVEAGNLEGSASRELTVGCE